MRHGSGFDSGTESLDHTLETTSNIVNVIVFNVYKSVSYSFGLIYGVKALGEALTNFPLKATPCLLPILYAQMKKTPKWVF
jgi:hypothetical protein